MPPTTIHHHPSATSATLTASLLTLYPSAHAPPPELSSAAFHAFPTHSQRPGAVDINRKAPAPTFAHTSSLYRSALPEPAPTSGQPPKKAFIQLLTLSSRPNLTFVTSSFPLGTTRPDKNNETSPVGNGESKDAQQSTGTVALQAGEQTRSFVMLLSTRLGGLWTVARGWDVVVEGRHWIISVPLKRAAAANGTAEAAEGEDNGKPTTNGASTAAEELVDVEIGIGDVSLRGVAGSTREGQRGAVIFGNLLPSSMEGYQGSHADEASHSFEQRAENALQEIIKAVMSAVALDGAWDAIQGQTTAEDDEVQVWSRVLRSRVSGQVTMARAGSRQKS